MEDATDVREALDKQLASAPKYGANARYLLLQAMAQAGTSKTPEEATSKAGGAKAAARPSELVTVDEKLLECVPPALRPCIQWHPRAKFPKGARQQWANRATCLYIALLGRLLRLQPRAKLVAEFTGCAELCKCAAAAALSHEAALYKASATAKGYHHAAARTRPALKHIDADALQALRQRYGIPIPAVTDTDAREPPSTASAAPEAATQQAEDVAEEQRRNKAGPSRPKAALSEVDLLLDTLFDDTTLQDDRPRLPDDAEAPRCRSSPPPGAGEDVQTAACSNASQAAGASDFSQQATEDLYGDLAQRFSDRPENIARGVDCGGSRLVAAVGAVATHADVLAEQSSSVECAQLDSAAGPASEQEPSHGLVKSERAGEGAAHSSMGAPPDAGAAGGAGAESETRRHDSSGPRSRGASRSRDSLPTCTSADCGATAASHATASDAAEASAPGGQRTAARKRAWPPPPADAVADAADRKRARRADRGARQSAVGAGRLPSPPPPPPPPLARPPQAWNPAAHTFACGTELYNPARDPTIAPDDVYDPAAALGDDAADGALVLSGQGRSASERARDTGELKDRSRKRLERDKAHTGGRRPSSALDALQAVPGMYPAGFNIPGAEPSGPDRDKLELVKKKAVQAFVKSCLEPLLLVNAISLQQYTDAAFRAVDKVMAAHAADKDASFLQREAIQIRGLVDKYVRFYKRSAQEEDPRS